MASDSLIHDLDELTIRKVSVTSMDNNVYLLTSKQTGAQVLIDAAGDIAAITGMLEQSATDAPGGATLKLVITTHSHWDHVRALKELVDTTGAATAAGAPDAAEIHQQTGVDTGMLLENGDVRTVDDIELTAIRLTGHTPGSVAIAYAPANGPAHLFTGDSLFPGGVGNTDKDPERFATLLDDVSTRLFDAYGDDTVVHPGHGDPTTLGAERPQLGEWRARGW